MTHHYKLKLARDGILSKPIDKVGGKYVFDEEQLKAELEALNIYKTLGYTHKQILAEISEFKLMVDICKAVQR